MVLIFSVKYELRLSAEVGMGGKEGSRGALNSCWGGPQSPKISLTAISHLDGIPDLSSWKILESLKPLRDN